MNYITEIVSLLGGIGGTIAVMAARRSSRVDDAVKLIAEWQKLHTGCEERVRMLEDRMMASEERAAKERQEMADQISRQDSKIKLLQDHIKKIEK